MATVRQMARDDVVSINRIYNHYIINTHISFDDEPWSDAERLTWFDTRARDDRYPMLVVEEAGEVLGSAWSGLYRDKSGYARSVETTVVLDPEATGRGLGRTLLNGLIDALRDTDAHRLFAIVALPNEASISMHHSLGYRTVGRLSDSGYKFGRYWSTEILELRLS